MRKCAGLGQILQQQQRQQQNAIESRKLYRKRINIELKNVNDAFFFALFLLKSIVSCNRLWFIYSSFLSRVEHENRFCSISRFVWLIWRTVAISLSLSPSRFLSLSRILSPSPPSLSRSLSPSPSLSPVSIPFRPSSSLFRHFVGLFTHSD